MGVKGVVAVYDIYDDYGTHGARAILETTGERSGSRFVSGEKFDEALFENTFIDYAAMKYYRSFVMGGDTITSINKFRYIKSGESGFENIAGWLSKMVEFTRDGDSYQIWYTDNLGFKGTPWPELGIPQGLVMKIVRNGKVIAVATRVTQKSIDNGIFPASWGKTVNNSKYDRLQKKFIYL